MDYYLIWTIPPGCTEPEWTGWWAEDLAHAMEQVDDHYRNDEYPWKVVTHLLVPNPYAEITPDDGEENDAYTQGFQAGWREALMSRPKGG